MPLFKRRARHTDVKVIIDSDAFVALRDEMMVLLESIENHVNQMKILKKQLDQATADSKRTIKDLKALQSHRPVIRNH